MAASAVLLLWSVAVRHVHLHQAPPARAHARSQALLTATDAVQVVIDVSSGERDRGVLAADTLRRARASFVDRGVVVLHNVLSEGFVDACAERARDNLLACRERLSGRGIRMEEQGFAFREICHRSKGRFDMQLQPGVAPVPVSDPAITLRPPWMPLVKLLLGDTAHHLFTGAVVSVPGSAAQNPHMDGGHLFGIDGDDALMCPVHCLNVFVPLVDVTRAKGPTEFWPGSHRLGHSTIQEGAESVAPELLRGSIAMFDYRVVHRGLPNSSGEDRPVMYVTYSRPWFRDRENFPDESLFPEVAGGGAVTAATAGAGAARAPASARGFAGSGKAGGKNKKKKTK